MAALVRPSELAKMLGVPQQKIYQWAKRGLPLRKTEEGTRIDLDEAKEFFERIGIPWTGDAPLPPKSSAAPAKSPTPGVRATVTTVAEGQFLVWPKGATQGVTIGKVTQKEPSAGVVVVKCDDGSEAIFSSKELNRLIREGKIRLTTIDEVLELVADELRYFDLDHLADQILRVRDAYREATRTVIDDGGQDVQN